MSYGSYNNYSHGGGGGGYNQRRINEDDVPESKHTIFIRGLPGSISTDEVKDYFEDKIGPVSFDFVKQSPDNQRLFVAVRFETREDAKTAMSRYVDRDLMGYRCELSWFKDIRRYAQYQQAQGRGGGGMNRNNRGGFRGRASYRGGQGYDRSRYDDRDRSRSRDRSRTPHSRDSSRSSRGRSRTRSRSSRSASPARRSRSSSRDSYESRRKSDRDGSLDEERRKRKKDKKHKKRKNRSRSHSHSSEGELKSDDDIRKLRNGVGREPTASPISNRDESESPQRAPVLQGSAPFKFNIKKKDEVAATVQNTAFSIGMDDNDEPPRIIRRLTPDSRGSTKSDLLNGNTGNNDKDKSRSALLSGLPPPPAPPSFHQKEKSRSPARECGTFRPITQQTPPEPSEPPVKRERKEAEPVQVAVVETVVEEQEVEILTPPPPPAPAPVEEEPARPPTPPPPQAARKPQPPPVVRAEPTMAPQSSASKYPTTSKLFAELRAFQSKIIKDVKAEPKQEEGFGGLRLSSLAMQNGDDDEATKQALREEKLAALDEMQMERFMVHKKKLEAAFRNDCQTFAFVTKQLLSKDESLEQSLRIALIENLEDLEKQLMEKVDAYLG